MLKIQSQIIKSLSCCEVIIWAALNRKSHPTVTVLGSVELLQGQSWPMCVGDSQP